MIKLTPVYLLYQVEFTDNHHKSLRSVPTELIAGMRPGVPIRIYPNKDAAETGRLQCTLSRILSECSNIGWYGDSSCLSDIIAYTSFDWAYPDFPVKFDPHISNYEQRWDDFVIALQQMPLVEQLIIASFFTIQWYVVEEVAISGQYP